MLAAASRAPAAQGFPTKKVPAPVGVLTRLPGNGDQQALTIDDGGQRRARRRFTPASPLGAMIPI